MTEENLPAIAWLFEVTNRSGVEGVVAGGYLCRESRTTTGGRGFAKGERREVQPCLSSEEFEVVSRFMVGKHVAKHFPRKAAVTTGDPTLSVSFNPFSLRSRIEDLPS